MSDSETRVLVVEDDPDIADYITSFLEDEGFLATSASRCSTAHALMNEFRPDIVLIDALLPGKSGLDFLVTLRRDARWSSLPLVIVTGNDMLLEDDCQSYLGAHQGVRGPDGVLGKPVDRSSLVAVIRKLVG
jgi:DNA-binding response OmpR family regulator